MRLQFFRPFCVLLASGLAALAADSNPSDDFYQAIRRDDFATVEKLLQAHGPNFKDRRGSTPLMYAAASGSEAMMRLLIRAGADPKISNVVSASALHWCGGIHARMKLLVEHGADVNLRSKQGHTPLFLAASQAGGLDSVRLLLEHGADLHAPPGPGGATPLSGAADANDTATMKFLLEKGGDAIVAPPGGPRALISVAMHGNLEMVKLLLAKGVPGKAISPPVPIGQVKNGPIALASLSALSLSVAGGNTEVVRALLEAGADVNVVDIRGMTPLMFAVATDHPNREIIAMLLDRKPDLTIRSKAGETALDWAMKFQDAGVLAAVRGAQGRSEAAEAKTTTAVPTRAAGATPAGTLQERVQKSVSLLQRAAATNFAEGGCVSCHAGNATTSVVAAVRRKGIRVDEAAAGELVKATRLQFAGPADGLLERSDLPAVEILTFGLAALADEGAPGDRITDALVYNLAAQQLPGGNWTYRGIMRPPTSDHLFTNAAFAIRAFRTYAPPARKQEYEERIARAVRVMQATKPETTEDAVMLLLGTKWSGTADAAGLKRLVKGVLALQRKDGGWSQTPRHSSDAYATGIALYALSESGVVLPAKSAEYRRGVQFLMDTQAADGSWHVVSRAPKFQPYFEGGFPYGHDQWISQWATSWSTIAMSRMLPEGAMTAKR